MSGMLSPAQLNAVGYQSEINFPRKFLEHLRFPCGQFHCILHLDALVYEDRTFSVFSSCVFSN